MMITVYGIPNCDTMKKARAWLDKYHIAYQFHDYKKQGITQALLKKWCAEVGFEALINQRGTTWRKLDATEKANLNQVRAITLMMAHPSVIKRPVIDTGKQYLIGFDENTFKTLLK